MKDRILIIDDEENIRYTLKQVLEDEGYEVDCSDSLRKAEELLANNIYSLVFLDLWLQDEDGMELLDEVKSGDSFYPPIVVISGHGTVDTVVEAIKKGAYDFIEKPLSISRLLVTTRNAIERFRLKRELLSLTKQLDETLLIGKSQSMKKLKMEVIKAAQSDSRVLIVGEHGTGKELVARAIHKFSKRKNKSFVDLNCAAIPEELIESEMFGHLKGAFTGATARRIGALERAHEGTLFLDEIGDMSLRMQAKLLRVLEEQRFVPLGGHKEVEVDIRIVAATNKDLQEEIELKRFREDLFFRLAVIPIKTPPLRERKEDIPLLISFYLEQFSRKMGLKKKSFTSEALEILTNYSWPGNVRELKNFVERVMIMVPSEVIDLEDLPPEFKPARNNLFSINKLVPLKEARAKFEREYINYALSVNKGNVAKTAEMLQVERSHLYRKIKGLGITNSSDGEGDDR